MQTARAGTDQIPTINYTEMQDTPRWRPPAKDIWATPPDCCKKAKLSELINQDIISMIALRVYHICGEIDTVVNYQNDYPRVRGRSTDGLRSKMVDILYNGKVYRAWGDRYDVRPVAVEQ